LEINLKKIDTLVEDIQQTLLNGVEEANEELLDKYAASFKELLRTRLAASERQREGTLRMSNIGKPCERQLWYEVNAKGEAEPLPPEAFMKFLYGDLCELLLLYLVEVSGHDVQGTQDTQEIEGIKGHRDAVIDGTIVDVKSASAYSFKKFSEGRLEEDDAFGYVDQLQSYLYSGQTDDKVTDKSRGAFLVLDKVLGHICLDIHQKKDIPYDAIYRHKKEVVNSPELPERGFEDVPEGKSGNRKLGVNCSYCSFRDTCWTDLRTFIYSSGVTHLTKVVNEPRVPEIK
jgi:hypothetical protein